MATVKTLRLFPIICLWLFITGCGVKGDPLPPERPAELGRGRPTYRRAAERVRVLHQKPEEVLQPEEDEDETEEEE
jgi:hypothetical protein